MIGQTLAQYVLLEHIGAGGMGVVYRARDERLERDVAIKVLPPGTLNEVSRKRFRKEAAALSRLNHPNVATVHDFNTQDGVDYLVMEYIPGTGLDAKLLSEPLPERDIVRTGSQIAEGLAAAHEQGVVHRDLKPSNIRLTPDGRAKILDFGLAKILPVAGSDSVTVASMEAAEVGAGTLPYMAPEQLLAERIDERTDIYALGNILYEMATGQRPFPERHMSRMVEAILHQLPQPPRNINPKLSPELERIILKCLEKDPENRYQAAKELAVDLRRLATASAAPIAAQTALRFRRRRRHVPLSLVIVSILLTALVVGYVSWWKLAAPRAVAPARIDSLAVLPLANISGDPAQQYFADGMTEELVSDLTKIGALRVVSLTRYKESGKPLAEVARQLGIGGRIEGSVMRVGNRVRVTVQLVDNSTQQNLWADSYERNLGDVLSLQNEVASAIARKIQVAVTPEEQAQLSIARHVDPAAHESYLRGRFYWNKRTPDDLKRALGYFQKAAAEDPGYGPAYAGMADCYALLSSYHGLMPAGEAMAKGKAAASKALEIDPNLGEAYASLAGLKFFYLDFAGIEQDFQRALQLNPGYATAHHWYALYLAATGHHPEALAQIKIAQNLDPLSFIISANVGWCYYLGRRYDEAIAQLQRTLELNPNFPAAHEYLGQAYLEKSRYSEAIAELQTAVQLSHQDLNLQAELANAYAVAGQPAKAQEILQQLVAQPGMTAYGLALAYTGLGDKDNAFLWLNRALDQRDTLLVNLEVHPRIDTLRPDPRYRQLLERMRQLKD